VTDVIHAGKPFVSLSIIQQEGVKVSKYQGTNITPEYEIGIKEYVAV
jgi:hypothetical protein